MKVRENQSGPSSEINMTPMIDILLVLLIIFMVVQQALQRGMSVQVPPIESSTTAQSIDQIVLEVLPGGTFRLNQQPVASAELRSTLRTVYAPRPRKVIFIRGDERATYGEVAWAVDVARSAGIEVVGLVPRTRSPSG